MKTIAEKHGYRGVEFSVREDPAGTWRWSYYPKVGQGVANHGQVEGTMDDALAACHAAIDEWLGPA